MLITVDLVLNFTYREQTSSTIKSMVVSLPGIDASVVDNTVRAICDQIGKAFFAVGYSWKYEGNAGSTATVKSDF